MVAILDDWINFTNNSIAYYNCTNHLWYLFTDYHFIIVRPFTSSLASTVCALQGMRRNPTTGIKTKIYGNEEADVPIQMALWSSPAADARFQEVCKCNTIRYTTLTTQLSVVH